MIGTRGRVVEVMYDRSGRGCLVALPALLDGLLDVLHVMPAGSRLRVHELAVPRDLRVLRVSVPDMAHVLAMLLDRADAGLGRLRGFGRGGRSGSSAGNEERSSQHACRNQGCSDLVQHLVCPFEGSDGSVSPIVRLSVRERR